MNFLNGPLGLKEIEENIQYSLSWEEVSPNASPKHHLSQVREYSRKELLSFSSWLERVELVPTIPRSTYDSDRSARR